MQTDLERLEILRPELEAEGYKNLTVIDGRGICGLKQFIFTVGLVEHIDSMGYGGRYCYPNNKAIEALIGITTWDGKEDPVGDWIKYKGRRGEYSKIK